MEKKTLEEALNEAEAKAWAALVNYKFMMFGYWAAIWVHLNKPGWWFLCCPCELLLFLVRLHR